MIASHTKNIATKFDGLCQIVQACRICPRMEGSARVLSDANGHPSAPLLFIGEAPGRLGAELSGIPFHGDEAGHNFESFLESVGLSRSAVFVTNAVLCNPRDALGNNSTPDNSEIRNCSKHLKAQIDLINPPLVVTLGAVALMSLSNIEKHNLTLSSSVRTAHKWYGRKLIPLYHPSKRALIARNRIQQQSDYQFVKEQLTRLHAVNNRTFNGSTKHSVLEIVFELLKRKRVISYFALHKLFYLTELTAIRELGHRLTSAFIVRQKDGPYCTDLHYTRLKRSSLPILVRFSGSAMFIELDPNAVGITVPSSVETIIDKVMERYGEDDESTLKTKVYLSGPMRTILKKESSLNKAMYNAPLLREKIPASDLFSEL